jgi:two-component system phosphate regulon response regulator OmpR
VRVLVIEDDEELAETVAAGLRHARMAVDVALDGAAGLARALLNDYDVIVLDRDLPGLHGDRVCARLVDAGGRSRLLMLTAAATSDDLIDGLALGADDYLPKPFEPEELLLRIEAILRRAGAQPQGPERLTLGRCSFDPGRGELSRDEEPVRLTEAETRLLRRLAANAHAPVDRVELARETADPSGRAVDVQVTRLRRKIEADPKAPRYLQTVRGIGYMLAPD